MHPSSALTHTDFQRFARPQRELAGSKSLGAMLPTILTTGVITLVASAIMRLVWVGFSNDFFAAWMEAWLTTWPIAFPLAYLSKPLINRVTNLLAPPAATVTAARPVASPGLKICQIDEVAAKVTAKNQLRVQRSAYIHRYY